MAFQLALFGEGTLPILLDEVNCVGNETSLIECLANPYSLHDCEHYEDAGVICTLTSTCVIIVYLACILSPPSMH